jgi:hypothetical protein
VGTTIRTFNCRRRHFVQLSTRRHFAQLSTRRHSAFECTGARTNACTHHSNADALSGREVFICGELLKSYLSRVFSKKATPSGGGTTVSYQRTPGGLLFVVFAKGGRFCPILFCSAVPFEELLEQNFFKKTQRPRILRLSQPEQRLPAHFRITVILRDLN